MKPSNMEQPHPLPKVRPLFDAVMQNCYVPHTLLLIFAIVYEGA